MDHGDSERGKRSISKLIIIGPLLIITGMACLSIMELTEDMMLKQISLVLFVVLSSLSVICVLVSALKYWPQEDDRNA